MPPAMAAIRLKMLNANSVLAKGACSTIKIQDVSLIENTLFDDSGNLKVLKTSELNSFDREKLRFFMWKHGIYTMPTVELIESLKTMIPDVDKCLEIGAGNGVYGRALGCRMTDNFMQHPKNSRKFRNAVEAYKLTGQPLVNYGSDVEELDGKSSVGLYKPETVICSWVTHKYSPMKHEQGGNMFGVDFNWIINRKSVKKIILIGNHNVHKFNPVVKHIDSYEIDSEHLISRATVPELDRIFVLDCDK